jgi:tRNA A-37 threonylcarbamoyl transferase component Bud32
MRPPELPEGYELLRRCGWWIAHRAGLRDHLLAVGDGDPRALATTGTGEFRGRGRPVLVTLPDGTRGVLRRYLHGGVLGRLTGPLFLGHSRPFGELVAVARARIAGVRAPEPLAAYHRRAALVFHEGYLLTREVAGARDLGRSLGDGARPGPVLEEVGREVRRMHRAGVFHADLHVKNVLLEDGGVTLLDFDRARVLDRLPSRLRHGNLVRFDRSVEKLGRAGTRVSRPDRLRFFRAYFEDGIEAEERASLIPRCRRNLFWHRLWWGVTGK